MTTISWIPPQVNEGTTTSWLPVTTAYPSLSGCASAFFEYPGQANPVGWDPGYGYWAGGVLSCGPPEETRWWEQNHQGLDGYTTLSIQPIVCPAAFTTAATEIVSGSSTNVRCCPSGYNLVGGQPGRLVGNCASSLSSGQVLTYTVQNETNYGWTQVVSTVTVASSILAIPMDGWNVAASPTSSSSAPTSTSTSSSNNGSDSNSSTRLSTGAKAGIGAGIAVFVIAVIGLIFLFFRRKRRSRPQPYAEADTQHPPPFYYNQGQPQPQPQSPPLSEVDSRNQKRNPTEMSVHPIRKYRDPAELETR